VLFAEDEDTPMPKQHAALKPQGMSPEVVSQQVLMQHAGQESKPEAAASAGRADAAADDAALVYLLLHHTHIQNWLHWGCLHCWHWRYVAVTLLECSNSESSNAAALWLLTQASSSQHCCCGLCSIIVLFAVC